MNKKTNPSFKIFKISEHLKRKQDDYGNHGCPAGKSIIIDLARTKKTLIWSSYVNDYDDDDENYVCLNNIASATIELPYKPCIIIKFYKNKYENYVYSGLPVSLYFGTRIGAFLYKTSLNETLHYDCGDWIDNFWKMKYPKTNNELIQSSIKIMNAFWQSSFNHFNPLWNKINKIKTIQKGPYSIKQLTETYML